MFMLMSPPTCEGPFCPYCLCFNQQCPSLLRYVKETQLGSSRQKLSHSPTLLLAVRRFVRSAPAKSVSRCKHLKYHSCVYLINDFQNQIRGSYSANSNLLSNLKFFTFVPVTYNFRNMEF